MSDDKTLDEPFDVMAFVKRHMRAGAWLNERSISYKPSELHALIKEATALFKAESSLATLSPPCIVVGDIHGQYRDLMRILGCQTNAKNERQFGFNSSRFMFLGDFVDRGTYSVECICLVFALKIVFPERYVLLRGNHETKAINYAYGFRDELINKLGTMDGVDVWESFNQAFAWMPLAGLIGGKILCMHGGISEHLTSLDDIRKIPRPIMDVAEHKLALDLLWSDPMDLGNILVMSERPVYARNAIRGLSVVFNDAAVKLVCKRLKVHLIVRAHQMIDKGFKFSAGRKLVTIFSAACYMQESDNTGAVLKVKVDGKISVIQLRPTDKENPRIVEDEPTRYEEGTGSKKGTTASKKKSKREKSTSSASKTKSTSMSSSLRKEKE